MRIAILDDYQDQVRHLPCFTRLAGHDVTILTQSEPDPERLAAKLTGVEALVLIRERTRIDEALLRRLPSLRLISQTGKISQHIDPSCANATGWPSPKASAARWRPPSSAGRSSWPPPATSRPIAMPRPGAVAAIRHTGAGPYLAGADARHLGLRQDWQAGGRLRPSLWHVGADLGQRGFPPAGRAGWPCQRPDKEAFFCDADILSLHLRLHEATRGCVTRTDLARMKADSLLVNVSRAELVEPGALYAELAANPTRRAALDVFDAEPATAQSEPLLRLPNVLATPHLGYVERNSYQLYFQAAFDNLITFAEGRPTNLVLPVAGR